MVCEIPCCDCDKYFICHDYLKKNRCNKCIHRKTSILESPCIVCKGFDYLNKNNSDYFDKGVINKCQIAKRKNK